MQVDFIIGVPRSGTTLLTTRLTTLPHVLALRESRMTAEIIKDFEAKDLEWNRSKDYVTKASKLMEKSDYHLVDSPSAKIEMDAPTNPNEVWESIAKCIQTVNNTPTKRIIDKNPSFTWHFRKLTAAFPQSKFLITNRDPRGFVLSKQQKRNKKNYIVTTSFMCFIWKDFQVEIEKMKSEISDRSLSIWYEDLGTRPEETLQQVCRFFDLPYSAELLEGYEVSMDTEIKRERIRQQDLSKSINSKRTTAWKEELSARQQKRIEVICRKEMEHLGIPTIQTTSSLDRAWIRCSAVPYWFLAKLRRKLIRRKF